MAYSETFSYLSGSTLYAIFFRRSDGKVWNTSGTPAFETWNAANIANYAVALTQLTGSSTLGLFQVSAPAGVGFTAVSDVIIIKQAGGSPAVTDSVVNHGQTGPLSDAVNVASIAADAITAAALAADAGTEIGTAVWATTTRILTAGTNIALAKGTGLTGLNDIAATEIVSAGAITTSSGKVSGVILVDSCTTNTDMRGTDSAGTATNLAAAKTVVDAIKLKTDNLPSDPADASDIAASFSTVNSTLATMGGYIDTEVAAIKAKTDNLPASPAAVGDAMTLTSGERTSIAAAVWAALTSGLATAGSVGKKLADWVLGADSKAVLSSSEDIYFASTSFVRDNGSNTDRYAIGLIKNGAELTAATITVPTLTVRSGDDNSTLISAVTLDSIANARFKYTAEDEERQVVGIPYTVTVVATVDGVSRTFLPFEAGRDST